jgi:hypothetical protein
MPRINYRHVRSRFTHIDATLIRARCALGDDPHAEYVVRFYPWWEHPRYLDARARNLPWAFGDTTAGEKEVVVHPVRPIAFKLSSRVNDTDWDFPDRHPLLWPYEEQAEIFCNSDVDIPALFHAVQEHELPFVTRSVLYEYINPLMPYRAPYSLGYFPTTLFRVVRTVLDRMGVRTFIAREPVETALPSLFLCDGDYIIADDFELQVPEFEHKDEWFRPELDPRPRV